MSHEDKHRTLVDRLEAFMHESYGLALTALGLPSDQIKDAAATVTNALANGFDWEGPLQVFAFSTEDGLEEAHVQSTSLEAAALSIAARNGWHHDYPGEPELEPQWPDEDEAAIRDIELAEAFGIAKYERLEAAG